MVVKTDDNGTEAITQSRKEGFDLIICNLAMDCVTGHDVIRVIKN